MKSGCLDPQGLKAYKPAVRNREPTLKQPQGTVCVPSLEYPQALPAAAAGTSLGRTWELQKLPLYAMSVDMASRYALLGSVGFATEPRPTQGTLHEELEVESQHVTYICRALPARGSGIQPLQSPKVLTIADVEARGSSTNPHTLDLKAASLLGCTPTAVPRGCLCLKLQRGPAQAALGFARQKVRTLVIGRTASAEPTNRCEAC